ILIGDFLHFHRRSQERAHVTSADGLGLFSQLLSLLLLIFKALPTPPWTTTHLDLSCRPIHLRVVFLQPWQSQNQVLLSKLCYRKHSPFGVVVVVHDHICDLCDRAALVRGSINVLDRDWTCEFARRNIIALRIAYIHE